MFVQKEAGLSSSFGLGTSMTVIVYARAHTVITRTAAMEPFTTRQDTSAAAAELDA